MSNTTAVARREERDEQQGEGTTAIAQYREYGALTTPARAALERSRALRRTADVIKATPWGQGLTPAAAIAMAEWCERRDVDPVTEIDNVGGPYLNSEYYLRKLGELRTRGVVADVKQRHIGPDARLAALAQDQHAPEDIRAAARLEHYERMQLRIDHGVPEEAAAAHLTAIYLVNGGEPITGVKWGGNGTSVKQPKAGGGSSPNPVVENNPALAVESQSVRRAMRQLAARFPGVLPDDDGVSAELGVLREQVRADARLARVEAAALPPGGSGIGLVSTEGYGADDAPAAVRAAGEYAAADPYGLGAPAAEPPPAIDAVATPDDEPDFSNEPFPDQLPLTDARPPRRGRDAMREG